MEIDLGSFVVRSYRPEDAPSLAAAANNPKVAANRRDRFPHSYLHAQVFEHNPASTRVLEKCDSGWKAPRAARSSRRTRSWTCTSTPD